MVGITLMPETIRSAPPEVRRWLEQQIATSLGLSAEGAPAAVPRHLVACGPQEAMAVYEAIHAMLPVVNVFFELGRPGESVGREGFEAHRLSEMLRHTRLQGPEQVAACLKVIDDVVRQMRGDAAATLCVIDRRGYCVIATETQRSIAEVWSRLLAARDLGGPSIDDPTDGPREGGQPFPRLVDPGLADADAAEADTDPNGPARGQGIRIT